jgi:hypothetical protein
MFNSDGFTEHNINYYNGMLANVKNIKYTQLWQKHLNIICFVLVLISPLLSAVNYLYLSAENIIVLLAFC